MMQTDSYTMCKPRSNIILGTMLVLVQLLVGVNLYAAPPVNCKRDLNIRAVTNLDFGTLMVSAAGVVVVDTNGARYSNGGVITAGGTVSAAEFAVGGCKDYAYDIVVQPTATISSGSNTMMIDNFIILPTTGLTSPKGKQSLFLGGTLHVNDAQPQGLYSGSFLLEVIGQ